MTTYSDLRSISARAQQIWLILIGAAKEKRILTYEMLAEQMGVGRRSARFMGRFLAPVYRYCRKHSLPFLTSLVVQKHSGIPGIGLRLKNVKKSQARVFKYDWYDVCPPTRKQFENIRTNV